MILIIDNFDSFTFNLVQCVGALGTGDDIVVRRNDAITLPDIEALSPRCLVVSPGPGTTDDGGISVEAIRQFAGRIPILGVCLGHQCIATAFGGSVGQAKRLMHGKTSLVRHDGASVFAGMPNPFRAARYHSLSVAGASVPPGFDVTATAEDDGEIMGIRHRAWPVEGVQFHPESFLTDCGSMIISNFLAPGSSPASERILAAAGE